MKPLIIASLMLAAAHLPWFAAAATPPTFADGLPVNPELPVSFGVNSRGGDRLKGEFLDAAVYSTVLTPKTIEAAARGVKPSVKPLWSGVPKAGDKCEAVRTAKFPRGFTLLATIRTKGPRRHCRTTTADQALTSTSASSR